MPYTVDREDYPRSIEVSKANISDMVNGYLDCQLWAGLDYRDGEDEPVPFDENYDRQAISIDYVNSVREELEDVVARHPLAVRMYLNSRTFDPSQGSVSTYFGHDFYLTREGHGTGLWDRGLGDLGDYLTEVARSYGPAANLFDDGTGTLIGE